MATTRAERPLRFLALGDSYTIGEGVDRDKTWPTQLRARLHEQAVDVGDIDMVATTGWTTDELQQAISARKFTPPYSLVSLLIGVNNQYRGRDLGNYAGELGSLIDFAVDMAAGDAGKLILVSIPDWGTTRYAAERQVDAARVAEEIDSFNAIARAACLARGAHWVDVTKLSREEARDMLAEDGLHPSADQYARWVTAILPVARSILDTAD